MVEELQLHFVRHGQVHNPRAVFYGRLPRFRLSDAGRAEAQCAGEHLAMSAPPLTALLCSPMLRARQTAAAVATGQLERAPRRLSSASASASAAACPVPSVQVEAALNECLTPASEGLPLALLAKRGWSSIYDGGDEPGGGGSAGGGAAPRAGHERFEDVFERVAGLAGRLLARHGRVNSGGGAAPHVACVTHGDCVFSALLLGLGLPGTRAAKDEHDHLYLETASAVSLRLRRARDTKRGFVVVRCGRWDNPRSARGSHSGNAGEAAACAQARPTAAADRTQQSRQVSLPRAAARKQESRGTKRKHAKQ